VAWLPNFVPSCHKKPAPPQLVAKARFSGPEGLIWRTTEGGVNGSRQKIFPKEMGTPTRRTRLPKHVSDPTTQVGQDHAATRVLLVLGTNNHLHELENAAELATRATLTYTGQTGEQHRSDRSLLKLTNCS
jgi:hypothetical protein